MISRIARGGTLGLAFIAGAVTCTSGTEPEDAERWVADLVTTQQVLSMTLRRRGPEVSGTATLASLTGPGGEPLTLTGTRDADSLRITYRREIGDPFRFIGRYTGPGITGILDGAEFVQVAVAFRSR